MRLYSHRSPSVLARILFVFFFVLSLSAYACLMPVHGATHAAMENGCSTPDVQPVSQYCESFKMVGVQPADTRHLNRDWQTICSEDSNPLSDHPTVGPPQDLLLKISVLRI